MSSTTDLPDSNSLDLYLSHPTLDECIKIWTNSSDSWKDSFTLPVYLTESKFLTTVPLAQDGGMTIWILVDKNSAPNQRPILCSCESFRKRSLTSDADGNVEENIVHGIASVFCAAEYRGRGYATRHMREMAKVLRNWQSEHSKCVGSVLYSDIGKTYYAKLGWAPNINNSHIVFSSVRMEPPTLVRPIIEEDLSGLCLRDEEMVRAAMAIPDKIVKTRLTILPDLDHMLWHIKKEEFASQYIFGKIPQNKGAIVGSPGQEVWAIWTHRYYEHPDTGTSANVLYILRLVVEGDETANKAPSAIFKGPSTARNAEQATSLKVVIQAAQAEAAAWGLNHVKLWEPSPLVRNLIEQSGLDYVEIEREEESIASGLWFGKDGVADEAPIWINNEHYAWC